MQDFSHLLRRLSDSGLEFIIVGGYAAISHGSSYLTPTLLFLPLQSAALTVGEGRNAVAGSEGAAETEDGVETAQLSDFGDATIAQL